MRGRPTRVGGDPPCLAVVVASTATTTAAAAVFDLRKSVATNCSCMYILMYVCMYEDTFLSLPSLLALCCWVWFWFWWWCRLGLGLSILLIPE